MAVFLIAEHNMAVSSHRKPAYAVISCNGWRKLHN